jgi:hypothetical protein
MFKNSEQNPLHKYSYQIPGQEKIYQINNNDQLNYQQQQNNNNINGQQYQYNNNNEINIPTKQQQINLNLLDKDFDQQIKLDDFICVRCNDNFIPSETVVNSGGQFWHAECFVYIFFLIKKKFFLIV